MMLLQSFEAQVKAAEQKKTFEDIEVEGEALLFNMCTAAISGNAYLLDSGAMNSGLFAHPK